MHTILVHSTLRNKTMSKICTFHFFPPISLLLLVFFSKFFTIEANNGGFTLDLFHRDSPKSPFYNPSLTSFQRIKNSLQRSHERINHLEIGSGLIPNRGEYLMSISYGTPPFEILAIVDTGSELTWLQCLPCTNCFKELYQPFDPKSSSTFQPVPCESPTCLAFQVRNNSCGSISPNAPCDYQFPYADSSYSIGDLATETITLGSNTQKMSFKDFVFGCGRDSAGSYPYLSSGLVGLGVGKFSFISQLNYSIGSKFSHCFGPLEESLKPGKISFGNHAEVYGDGVVSTPIFPNPIFYLANLEGISVANKRFEFRNPSLPQEGNIIIDSGTTVTYLPYDFYYEFRSAIRSEIKKIETVRDPNNFFDLCYSSIDDADVPAVTFHFRGGADLKLKKLNIFVYTSETSICLAFSPSKGLVVFGNLAQINMKVGYDLENRIISFKPTDCSTE